MRARAKRQRNSIIAALIIGSGIIIALIVFFWLADKNKQVENEVVLNDTNFQVTGLYGASFNYDEVVSLELKEELPKITRRSNGASLGEINKGDFVLEGLGLSRLYLVSDEGPYIFIKINDFYVIINHIDQTLTKNLYSELVKRVKLDTPDGN